MEPVAMLFNLSGALLQPAQDDDHTAESEVDVGSPSRNTSSTPVSIADNGPIGPGEAVLFAACTSACICATIIGNILVILSVFTYRPLRNVANFFIVSLAVADLAVAILVMPFNVANFIIGHWVFGEIFCNMWLTFDVLLCTASILNLCAVAVDRYYAIHDPINYAQKRTIVRVLVSIAFVWLASAMISVPPLFGWNNRAGITGLYDRKTSQCQLTTERSYVIYSAAGSFYIPLIIMTFVYVNVFRAVRRRLRERADAATAAKLAAAMGKRGGKTVESIDRKKTSCEGKTDEEITANMEASSGEGGDVKQADGDSGPVLELDQQAATQFSSIKSIKKLMEDAEGLNPSGSPSSGNDKKGNACGKGGGGGRGQVQQFLEEKAKISLSRERRAARTMAIIMGVFVICWLPFFLMYVILPFCKSCTDNTDPRVSNFITWLGYVNSSLNPIIYTIFNIDFRRAFKKLLQGNWRGH